ncbi:MAG: porin family protein [Bacteroidales bacterium]
MKRNILFLTVFLLMTTSLQAFEPPRMHPTDRFIVTPFTDLWQNSPDNMELKTIQRGVNIILLQDMPLGRSNFSIAAGLGFTSHNLYSDQWYRFHPIEGQYDFYPAPEDYEKNKLSLNYVDIPVQIRFRTRELNSTFRLYAGIKVGYLINAHTKFEGKVRYFDHDILDETEFALPFASRTTKFKEHDLNNLYDWHISLTAMIGYGRVNFQMYYPLNDMFKDNPAEEMLPISLGLAVIVF